MEEEVNIMDSIIPLSEPDFTGNELSYITEAIKTGWFLQRDRMWTSLSRK